MTSSLKLHYKKFLEEALTKSRGREDWVPTLKGPRIRKLQNLLISSQSNKVSAKLGRRGVNVCETLQDYSQSKRKVNNT